jgi:hypothetical protein
MKKIAVWVSLAAGALALSGCNEANDITGPTSPHAVAPVPRPAQTTPSRGSPLEGQRPGRGEPRLVPPRPTPTGRFHPTYPPCLNVTVTGDLERKNKPCIYD